MTKKDRPIQKEDDGHTIAPMNVEGMPFYRKQPPEGGAGGQTSATNISRRETWWMIWGSLKAALLLAGIFALAIVILVWVLQMAWR